MLDHYYAVIMAGGGGTRLWPLSRKTKPKQMLSLFDERTLFQTSVQRLYGLFPPERIFIVTVREQADELRSQTPEIPHQNFLLEPLARGTASVVGLAAVVIERIDPQAVMAVLTADHFIKDEARFRSLLIDAHQVALTDTLVTLGIEPTFPATGFGYIQRGDARSEFTDYQVFDVLRFKEKPDETQARKMLEAGDHVWNSGMFVWKVATILKEFEQQMPDLYHSLQKIKNALGEVDSEKVLKEVWKELRPETIDYGIMERASLVAVIPAGGLGWSDVGSWDSLFEVLEGDAQGNIVMGGEHIALDTHRTLVYVNQEHRMIVTIGVEDLVLVDTGDVLLVCHKDQAQRVRQVVDHLKQEGRDYL
ncbi:MAG TPA: mannose-1-phosphate guanylyltransferase [Anaerolineales bacterium]|nr:mannose-1-phosphate guanylyltransferase [Anaerolineales bacterium]